MMKCYYKTYVYIMICLICILVFFGFSEATQTSFEAYYITLHNRAIFIMMYLPLFLIGVIPVAMNLTIYEVVVRYNSKFELVWNLQKPLFIYSVCYAGIGAIMVFLLAPFLEQKDSITEFNCYIFVLCGMLIHTVSWFLIANIFLVLYSFFRKIIWAYLITMAIYLMASYIGMIEELQKKSYYLSGPRFMYVFFEIANIFEGISYMTYYCLLLAGSITITYQILKYRDLLFQARGKNI